MYNPRPSWTARALVLYFKLNADRINYTPRSHKGERANNLIEKLQRKIHANITAKGIHG